MKRDNEVTLENPEICNLSDLVEGQMFSKPAGHVVYMFAGHSSSVNKLLYISLEKGYRNWVNPPTAKITKVCPVRIGQTVKIVQR